MKGKGAAKRSVAASVPPEAMLRVPPLLSMLKPTLRSLKRVRWVGIPSPKGMILASYIALKAVTAATASGVLMVSLPFASTQLTP